MNDKKFLTDLQDSFLCETSDFLFVVNESLEKLKTNPVDSNELTKIARLFYRIKTEASALELNLLSLMCRTVENFLNLFGKKKIFPNVETIAILGKATTTILDFVEDLKKDKKTVCQFNLLDNYKEDSIVKKYSSKEMNQLYHHLFYDYFTKNVR